MGESSFGPYFRQRVGMTFRLWLTRRRIERACQLLSQSDVSVNRVGKLVGFGAERTFRRAFRLHVGCSASQYRKRRLAEEARRNVHRFIEAWNSRSPAPFAATLQYPHVRPTADFDGRVFADAAAYAATVDFDQVLATGWDRTRLDSATVVHAGESQAHVAGRYTRLREDGSPIWSNQINYVVTEKDGSTGIQARFAAGFDDLAERGASAAAAVAVIHRYLEAFNARDEDAMVATFHFPHVRVGGGGARVSKSAGEYMDAFDFDAFAERLGWERSGADTMEAIQVGARGVNVAVGITRYAADDAGIHSFDTIHLVTEDDWRWGDSGGFEQRFLRLRFERRPS